MLVLPLLKPSVIKDASRFASWTKFSVLFDPEQFNDHWEAISLSEPERITHCDTDSTSLTGCATTLCQLASMKLSYDEETSGEFFELFRDLVISLEISGRLRASVLTLGEKGLTPLFTALAIGSATGDTSFTDFLLARLGSVGLNQELPTETNPDALFFAVMTGDNTLALIILSLYEGLNLLNKPFFGITALHAALAQGQRKLAEDMFIFCSAASKTADLNVCLFLAALGGSKLLMKMFLESEAIDWTAVITTVSAALNPTCLREVLSDERASVSAAHLSLAIRQGAPFDISRTLALDPRVQKSMRPEGLELKKTAAAEVNLVATTHPLFVAAATSQDVLLLSLMCGPCVDYWASLCEEQGNSLIHYLAASPSSRVMKHSLAYALDPETGGDRGTINRYNVKNGYTPLHLATSTGNFWSIRMLLACPLCDPHKLTSVSDISLIKLAWYSDICSKSDSEKGTVLKFLILCPGFRVAPSIISSLLLSISSLDDRHVVHQAFQYCKTYVDHKDLVLKHFARGIALSPRSTKTGGGVTKIRRLLPSPLNPQVADASTAAGALLTMLKAASFSEQTITVE